ncbi:MAG: hypothetical protein WC557_09030 [Ignavibacteriaceae bacterium]
MEIIPIAIGTNNLKLQPFIHSTSFIHVRNDPDKVGTSYLVLKIFLPF